MTYVRVLENVSWLSRNGKGWQTSELFYRRLYLQDDNSGTI